MTATLAFFDIEKKNTLAPVSCDEGVGGRCSQQVGAESSRGTEFEVNYAPTENLQFIGGVAYTDAHISRTFNAITAPQKGAQLTNSSKQMANLWARYNFPENSILHNFGVGVGLSYNSETPGSLPTQNDSRVLMLPSSTLADMAAYYRMNNKYEFTLKIGNLFDRRYYGGVNSTDNEVAIVPGSPRHVTFSVRVPIL